MVEKKWKNGTKGGCYVWNLQNPRAAFVVQIIFLQRVQSIFRTKETNSGDTPTCHAGQFTRWPQALGGDFRQHLIIDAD